VNRYNSDLANGLGNLASRTLAMIAQYRRSDIPQGDSQPEIAALAQNDVPLLATLAAAMGSQERGNFTPFSNQLRTFQHKVSVQVAPSAPALANRAVRWFSRETFPAYSPRTIPSPENI
jgi:methionyl-tRNA synthetase